MKVIPIRAECVNFPVKSKETEGRTLITTVAPVSDHSTTINYLESAIDFRREP